MTGVVEDTIRQEATLRRLELLITRRLDGMLHGEYQGLLPGAGSEPGEAREYELGDDVRHMDWNLTARTTIPHVRDSVADRELETWLVVDATPSMAFGTTRSEKRELAVSATAAFALLTNRAGNRSGAAILDRDRIHIVPARTGRDAALALLHRLVSAEPDRRVGRVGEPAGPTLASALERVDRVALRRGLVVVISDFLDPGDWPKQLRRLGRRHQVVAIEIRDPREDELPAVGLLTLVDPESGRLLEVQTNKPQLRARFAAAAAERRRETLMRIRAAGARHAVLSTDRDWMLDLMNALERWRRLR